ncbi:SAM-dependent methyltransferase [Catenulispora subtropica]|uniref:SAM-dependent methyltransferase n=1 Tax=Catenulispora subtropica TaxID=450798 RepID=A0ABN2R059_9ACTN
MTDEAQDEAQDETMPQIDTGVPHSARIFNYWLGGKDNYPADREAGDRFREIFPEIVDLARSGRQFLVRTVRHLTAEAGIRQFLDIGTGLPTANNTHEIAQGIAPDSRIVYVDNDPLVLAHAQALLVGTPEGATDYIEADLDDPAAILSHAAKTLDLRRPVAIVLMGILAHIDEHERALAIVEQLMSAVPSGSYLVIRDGTDTNAAYQEAISRYNQSGAVPYNLRSPEQIASYFRGLELVEPGLVSCPLWRPDSTDIGTPVELAVLGAIGRKV